MKKCPACAEEIQDEAKKCKHCGHMLPVAPELSMVATGAMGGCLGLGIGMWVAAAMILVGSLLCMTGVGAIVGVPFILVGLVGIPLSGAAGLLMGASQGKPLDPAQPGPRYADPSSWLVRALLLLGAGGLAAIAYVLLAH